METKRWIKEYFVELINDINDVLGGHVILFGGETDIEIGEFIGNRIKNKRLFFNNINRTGLRQTAAIMSLCKLVVANDSGPLYMAAAAGVPTVSIYGPTIPFDKVPQ